MKNTLTFSSNNPLGEAAEKAALAFSKFATAVKAALKRRPLFYSKHSKRIVYAKRSNF